MARIDEGCQAWQAGHLARFGQLITESGISSEKNYETGTEALVSLSGSLVLALVVQAQEAVFWR